ncbi:dihydroorotate dehydrogenase [Candidatus Parcubacteria bacterium]|nr:MAG: dihydroorotate dehydrogenase [Candidatus Parcubacteria bacterium]
MSTKLCGVKLQNPTILASGILGVTASSMVNIVKNGAGAVTTKSCDLNGTPGHANPKLISFEHGLLNCVGLTNPGIKEKIEVVKECKEKNKTPLILSIYAKSADDFGKAAELADKSAADLIEVNISCPNVKAGGKSFSFDPQNSARITKLVKQNTSKPVFIKLSPITPEITNVALACKEAGADGITAINTLGPGMIINIEAAKPVLSNKVGGVSGPAIFPIAVRCVYDIYKATKLPIIGTGGIMTGRDAVQMMMAGAVAVGIGSGIYYRGKEIFRLITEEIKEFMQNHGYKNLKEIIGKAHE